MAVELDEDGLCKHGFEEPTCSLCWGKPAPVSRGVEFSSAFQAQFAGTCQECGFDISVGDTIALRLVDGERRGVVHERCIDL